MKAAVPSSERQQAQEPKPGHQSSVRSNEQNEIVLSMDSDTVRAVNHLSVRGEPGRLLPDGRGRLLDKTTITVRADARPSQLKQFNVVPGG